MTSMILLSLLKKRLKKWKFFSKNTPTCLIIREGVLTITEMMTIKTISESLEGRSSKIKIIRKIRKESMISWRNIKEVN